MSAKQAKDFLQLPHEPSHAVEFSTKQILDDIHIPNGRWNTDNIPEPITATFPEWGAGGGTQAITNSPIEVNPNKVVELKNE
ncbi:hypothetical protein A1QC_10950 [Vibrio rumoiensis 1S-45]|uniref:Uncharacterized protein n=2 Tax=Vibrio rumoiensis TaxID=76258 RepID=A0A1E5E069_9VIBR|nr:hypothetical protein A1QC_10950 [Vibrio rumoiensis 1S-45]